MVQQAPAGPSRPAVLTGCRVTAVPSHPEPRGGTCGQAAWAGLTVLSLAGALIDHDKLLLQINPERELGDMSYKLGQVSHPASPGHCPARFTLFSVLRFAPRNTRRRK